jgi:hypothetical protein
MEVCAELASIYQELNDGVYRNIRKPRNRPHGRTLAKHIEHLGTGFDG